ncbi:MAG: aspartate--tRNA ligase [Bacilli bacterium]
MEGIHRTHQCGLLGQSEIGEEVVLSGWVQKRRDLGGLIFIDLRDRSGIVQVVFNPDDSRQALDIADKMRNEYVVKLKGKVVLRDEAAVNKNLPTGTIEVLVQAAEIINTAKNPPFFIQDNIDVEESVRLKYRYLDLRRPELQRTFMMRSKVTKLFRDYLDQHGFLEVETPILTKSTPEGARDYLVPSRVHEGEFYALPQSPQLFKQLLMVSGFERYYQVARCFRDEDLRADRQPEFTQIDIEMSFMTLDAFQQLMESLMAEILEKTVGVKLEFPIQRITYQEAIDRYGSDKPDLRFEMEIKNVSLLVSDCGFKVFVSAIENGGQVKGITAKGCASFSRKEVDELGEFAAVYKAKGLAWLAVKEDGIKGPIAKFFSEEELQAIQNQMGAETGDLMLFVADNKKVVADSLGNLRLKIGKQLKLIDESQFKLLWVTEFPLLEYDEDADRYVAAHHPFTMPMLEDLHMLESDPASVRAQAYDMVLNGYEIGGGSMRIYQKDIQEKMFQALGFSLERAYEQFGFLLDAFEYGTPPHGGMALGLDRIIMILAGRSNLRDCIAFPKTASAVDLLTNAPSPVDGKQLDELHIMTKVSPK